MEIIESTGSTIAKVRSPDKPADPVGAADHRSEEWLGQHAEIHSDSRPLNAAISRSLLDLGILEAFIGDLHYFSAGLPWYGTLFGRDSIIAALQTLAFDTRIAGQTIRLLARYQSTQDDDWRDAQPGKILHELRRGELANLNEIPQTPYYGSVDATPLFLILVGEHANWSGDLSLFNEIRTNVQRALRWIDQASGGGFLAYDSRSSKGLGNQGWKDSGDSIMNSDGSLATPPIALVEVQGYVYRAKQLIADLYARSGDSHAAARLRSEADSLKLRFNRDFWLEDKKFYALALQNGGRPADVISSNPGQALWTGIIDHARSTDVVARLMADDMFNGWGIRTLSSQERRYNPAGYHLGTVWPHDNSIIAAGLCRCGFDRDAVRVFKGILNASAHFDHARLPEVFAGYSQAEFPLPVRYPVACHPQAWAAGAVPFMLTALLGITAEAFDGRLRVRHPVLPHGVSHLELRRLKVGRGSIDLSFHRTSDGGVKVDVINQAGNIHVEVEPAGRPKAA